LNTQQIPLPPQANDNRIRVKRTLLASSDKYLTQVAIDACGVWPVRVHLAGIVVSCCFPKWARYHSCWKP